MPCPRYRKAEIDKYSRSDEAAGDLHRYFLSTDIVDDGLYKKWLCKVEATVEKSRKDASCKLPFIRKEGALQKAGGSGLWICKC